MTSEPGLRERKKAQTRQRIADAAAHLFATRGYDQVAMAEVARAAEVSDQTVYNYFPAKHDLVLDQAEAIRRRYGAVVRERPEGMTPAAALRALAREDVERHRHADPDEVRGQFITLSVAAPSVRRHALVARDEQVATVAAAISDTDPHLPAFVVHAHAAALIALFQVMTDRMGRGVLDDADPAAVAEELSGALAPAFDDLDEHFQLLATRFTPTS